MCSRLHGQHGAGPVSAPGVEQMALWDCRLPGPHPESRLSTASCCFCTYHLNHLSLVYSTYTCRLKPQSPVWLVVQTLPESTRNHYYGWHPSGWKIDK